MMSTTRYVVLAISTLAIGVVAIESTEHQAAGAELDVWEAAWIVALYEQRRREKTDAWVIFKRTRAIYEADREGHVAAAGENYRFAVQTYEDARMKHNASMKAESAARNAAAKVARAIFETGRERDIAAWENYQTVLQRYEDAKMESEAAYKAERIARRAVRDAVGEAKCAARNAVRKANSIRESPQQSRRFGRFRPEELEQETAADMNSAVRCRREVTRRWKMDDPAAILASLSHFETLRTDDTCLRRADSDLAMSLR